jgi:hypothetical protein
MPNKLSQWIIHREALLGIGSHDTLAEICGVARSAIGAIIERDSLAQVGRSVRAYLARGLEITVRDLEALAEGKIDWIADGHRIDAARLTPSALRTDPRAAALAPAPHASPLGQGVPILGRIDADGRVEFLEDWSSEALARLPVRFRGSPDAFALRTTSLADYPRGVTLVFRGAPPGQLPDRQPALITRSDADGESLFCYVEHEGDLSLRLISTAGEAGPLVPLEAIVRAARVIGTHGMGNE